MKSLLSTLPILIITIIGCSDSTPPKPTSFSIESIEVISLPESNNDFDTEVRILVTTQGGVFHKIDIGSLELIDNSGIEYSWFEYSDGGGSICFESSLYKGDQSTREYFSFLFPLSQVPEEATGVYFKTEISVADLPPKPISVLVRE